MYVKVCGLREKRLDEEDRIQDFTKTVEGLKKVRKRERERPWGCFAWEREV